MSDLSQAHVQRIYRTVSAVFVAAVLVIGGGVVYTGWSSTTITLTPLAKSVSTTFPITIVPTAGTSSDAQLVGTVTTSKSSATVTVEPSGDGALVPDHATGTMTIVNHTSNTQPLAATTRLKSDNGIIVRTTKRIDVPAGGEVEVTVTADPTGETGNLPAGKFIIVALWPGLQSSIYGELDEAMTGGLVKQGSTLSLDQLTAASNQGLEKIKADVGSSRPGTLIDIQPADVTTSPKPETPSASYTVTVNATVTTITYSDDRLQELVRTELEKSLTNDTTLATIAAPTLSITDRPIKDQAVLSIAASGTSAIQANSDILHPATYQSMTADAVQQQILASGLIKTVTVRIAPIWRTITPDQATRITIKLEPAVTQ